MMLLSAHLLTWQTTSEGFFLGGFKKVPKFIHLVAKKYVCTFWERHTWVIIVLRSLVLLACTLFNFFFHYSFKPPCFIHMDKQDSVCYWPKPIKQEFPNSLVKPASHYVQSQWDFKNTQWWKRVEWKVCPQHIPVEQLTSWRSHCLREWNQVSLCPTGNIRILSVSPHLLASKNTSGCLWKDDKSQLTRFLETADVV